MGIRHRVKWTVLSEDVRRHRAAHERRQPQHHGCCPDANLAKDKVDRIDRGVVTRTQPIKGSAAIVFDTTFDRSVVAHFDVIRAAYLMVDQLRNMRAEGARPDYIVNTIETGRSLLALHRSSVCGPAAAVLEITRRRSYVLRRTLRLGREASETAAARCEGARHMALKTMALRLNRGLQKKRPQDFL